jgi:hypothetical protein
MDVIRGFCDKRVQQDDKETCCENAVENIKNRYINDWRFLMEDMCPPGPLRNNTFVCVMSVFQELSETMNITDQTTPYEHMSDIFSHSPPSENIVLLSSVEDIVECVWHISREDVIRSLECMKKKRTYQGMSMALINGMSGDYSYTSEDYEKDPSIDEEPYSLGKRILEETIQKAIELYRLGDVLKFQVQMNANTTRKGDPHNVIFFWKSDTEGKVIGKKSWRNYMRTYVKKFYSDDIQKVKRSLENSGLYFEDADDPWVLATLHILERSSHIRSEYKSSYARVNSLDIKKLPRHTIGDVLKVFSKFEEIDDFDTLVEKIMKQLRYKTSTGKSFIMLIHDILWGPTRRKTRGVDILSQASSKIPNTSQKSKENATTPNKNIGSPSTRRDTESNIDKQIPKKRGRPKKTVAAGTTTQTHERKKTRRDIMKNAAETLSQLRQDNMEVNTLHGAVIKTSRGKEITFEMFENLGKVISSMHDVSMEDFIFSLCNSKDANDNHGSHVSNSVYVDVFRKLTECLTFEIPSKATIVEDGRTKTIDVTPMDIIVFFTEMLLQKKVRDTMKVLSTRIHTLSEHA